MLFYNYAFGERQKVVLYNSLKQTREAHLTKTSLIETELACLWCEDRIYHYYRNHQSHFFTFCNFKITTYDSITLQLPQSSACLKDIFTSHFVAALFLLIELTTDVSSGSGSGSGGGGSSFHVCVIVNKNPVDLSQPTFH